MGVSRSRPLAVSVGDPKCLVVAGGSYSDTETRRVHRTDAVEILIGDQWFMIEPLLNPTLACRHLCVHNGTLAILGRDYESYAFSVFYIHVDQLLQYCVQENSNAKAKDLTGNLWKTCSGSSSFYGIASFGQHLVGILGCGINIFNPASRNWIGIPDVEPKSLSVIDVVTALPNGKLVCIGTGEILHLPSYIEV